jgi:hypothetical protein
LRSKKVEKVEEWIKKASNLKIGKSFFLKRMDVIQQSVEITSIRLAIAGEWILSNFETEALIPYQIYNTS